MRGDVAVVVVGCVVVAYRPRSNLSLTRVGDRAALSTSELLLTQRNGKKKRAVEHRKERGGRGRGRGRGRESESERER